MIDVVVPVYKGLAQTRRCLESVLASRQESPFEVVAVDDASPEPEISRYLDALAADGRITLLRNEANEGFVRSVNRGMALHRDRDVVLLNSDTEVANDWLDRLHRCAHGAPDVATVTPFSNNATICSYPFEGWSGEVPGRLGLAALDRLFAAANAGRTVDLPTGVGFCMYIRRDALQALGAFDAERFGRGYGEENDFCMRAGKAGWRNVLAGDVFVFHEGSVSFSEDRVALMQAAGKKLVEIHPDYPARVHEFLVSDPASALRAAVDAARIDQGAAEAHCVLAERSEERARIMKGLWDIEKLATERDSLIGQLNRGLEHATGLVAERNALIAQGDEEIGKLRAGLAHAESLAFARADELKRIHSSRLWRSLDLLTRAHVHLRRRLRGTP
ncbi:MAG TPA: glycosyltransferase [Usitatibacter sp.]|nr:glycosyltransferase [Usitatibacter sp.]